MSDIALQHTVEELYNITVQEIQNVFNIFKNYFGEEYVDLQGIDEENIKNLIEIYLTDKPEFQSKDNNDSITFTPTDINNIKSNLKHSLDAFILVYWPEVTVTNEFNKSIDIQDLFVKVPISIEGTFKAANSFKLNRATYSYDQYISDYLHSHIPGIPDNATDFLIPCLGTGPIQHTMYSLWRSNDETLWMLFCQELSMYVTVESIIGGPYRRLETVGAYEKEYSFNYKIKDVDIKRLEPIFKIISRQQFHAFIEYYIKHGNIKFNYINNQFTLGNTEAEFAIDVSNNFIDYYNKIWLKNHPEMSTKQKNDKLSQIFNHKILDYYIIKHGEIYVKRNLSHRINYKITEQRGKFVCKFKGNNIYLTIGEETTDTNNKSLLLCPEIIKYILYILLKVINSTYGNNNNKRTESTTSSNKNVIYI